MTRGRADTLPLFPPRVLVGTPAPARRRGPDTSERAADQLNRTGAVNRLEADALAFVVRAGEHGTTFDAWAHAEGHPSSQSGRFTALAAKGLIIDSGQRRPTRSGTPARVFVASEAGKAVARA